MERVAHYSEVVNILHDLYPDFQLPEKLVFLFSVSFLSF